MYLDPVNVIYIARFEYPPAHHMPKHSHDFFHMLYINGGRGTMTINGNSYILEENQLFLCKPGCEHEFTSDKNHPLKTLEVKFYANNKDIFTELENISTFLDVEISNVRDIFDSTIKIGLDKSYLYRDIININVIQIILEILKDYNDERKRNRKEISIHGIDNADTCKSCDNLQVIVEYIEKNLNSMINLDTLAKRYGFNSSYLCRMFKEKYGVSPIQFLNYMRLKKAKELLSHSELNITEIADSVGFQSVHYFSRYFKQKEKLSPLDYKHSVSNTIYINFDSDSDLTPRPIPL